jgi:hypothetical protein
LRESLQYLWRKDQGVEYRQSGDSTVNLYSLLTKTV